MDAQKLTKLLLLFCGVALLLAGFFGLMIEFLENYNFNSVNSSIMVLMIGVVITMATAIIYYIIPSYQYQYRLRLLKQHYLNRPRGELMDLEHNILDTSQAAIWNIETLTILSDECCKNKIIKAECKDKLTIARKNLEQANTDINKLKYLINKLEDYDKINNA